uniref:NADH dehydrogenase subunit 2 n=1 Tax=Oxytelus finitimus TaxID=3078932 RepID=UPI002A816450|nr:NADH dehydrogenase subunit 2 [Oxytelus finitimus]WON66043.1 NADH dehydrogenase subunit 2 [Oxytelus finitimus]
MNFKYWKLMFIITLIMSIIITVSTFSWLTMWIGLEINMLCIIPLMNNTKNMYMTESSLKYFIVQAMASSMFLFSMIMMSLNNNMLIIMIMNSALLIKIGSAPFHFWFPEIMEGQKWPMCFIMLTFQKISPMMLLNYNMNLPLFFMIIIILNMLISAMMGLNQVSLRKILTFSSINHIGWMITSIFIMKMTWLLYFMIYLFILLNIVSILSQFKIYYMKQMINLPMNSIFKMLFILNFFSLGGLPPFIGFLPKWMTIQLMINIHPVLLFMMTTMTLLTLYYYIRLMMPSLLLSQTNLKSINAPMLWMTLLNNFSLFALPLTWLIFMS